MKYRLILGTLLAAVLLTIVATTPARAEGGRRYALLVGVQFYEPKSNLRELKYTEHDVEELAKVLQASGWNADNIVLMTQSLGARQLRFLPTGENIRRELNLLISDLEPNDTLLVAFSGHGVHLTKEKQSYFCPLDADLKQPETLIALENLYQSLKSCRAGHKILLCDACRDDPALAGVRRAEVALDSLTRPELDAAKGSAAFFSCSPGEVSYEHEDLKHGVFFHSVIDGLNGKADLDKDSEISLLELEFFVRKNVTDFVRARFGVKQRPEMLRQGNDVFPLLALPGQSGAPAESPDSSRRERRSISNSVGMQMVLLPAGEFLMGSPTTDADRQDDEGPPRRVQLDKPLRIAAHEVTVAQYRQFVTETGHTGSGGYGFIPDTGKFLLSSSFDWSKTGFPQDDTHPVVNVSWNDALKFCQWLSQREGRAYRLPTEAEWEFACRGGANTRFSSGDAVASLQPVANLADASMRTALKGQWGETWDDGRAFTAPVGSFRPNAFGLHDLHGNVWEWCADVYHDAAGKKRSIETRVVRGGSWANPGEFSRAADRSDYNPDERNLLIGFRVVCEP